MGRDALNFSQQIRLCAGGVAGREDALPAAGVQHPAQRCCRATSADGELTNVNDRAARIGHELPPTRDSHGSTKISVMAANQNR